MLARQLAPATNRSTNHPRPVASRTPPLAATTPLRQRAAAAAAKQDASQLADALQNGLRVVIDCSYVHAASATQHTWQRAPQHSSADGAGGTTQQQQQQSPAAQERQLVTGSFIHKEVRSMAKQLELSAALNKRSPKPISLTVTSFKGQLAAFANHMGAAAWPINTHPESLLELFDPADIVLLSPDAEEPLHLTTPLDAHTIYVIGGIVDKTVHKNLTIAYAHDHQLPAYRLPIKEHAQQLCLTFPGASTRPILSPADVVTALLEYHRTQDWVSALEAAVPKRKRRQHGAGAGRGGGGVRPPQHL